MGLLCLAGAGVAEALWWFIVERETLGIAVNIAASLSTTRTGRYLPFTAVFLASLGCTIIGAWLVRRVRRGRQ